MEPLVSIQKVSKIFKTRANKEIIAVNKVSFQIKKGEIFGLLGPNGAGKTTIVKMICGLIRPSGGKIFVNGHDSLQTKRVHKQIGVVLEGNRNLEWRLSARENLAYFGNLHFLYGKGLKKRIDDLLEFLDLKQQQHNLVGTLSRGMQQKVAIGVAMLADPPVLLLDEPILGLDVESFRLIKNRIKELSHKFGKSVLLTTHQMNVAQELCDRIAIIKEGKTVVEDRVAGLIDRFSTPHYKVCLDNQGMNPNDREKLMRLPKTRFVEQDGGSTTIIVEDEEALWTVLKLLATTRASNILFVRKDNPSLENIFLKIIRED
ncbi:MAG: hypothetical protein B1H40_02805 [Candidatus Latescibacteria bacterium 4484_181]|nr:MAG: hypothetical protein B1H40_02805 [Candidatus Latescibacteria bacterium 4484_181]